jgi:DNA-directed RNA polymerase specialized sigma24 family protein
MGRVKQGNLEPLEPLFRRHHEGLYRFFYLMTGDPEAAGFFLRELFQRIVRFRSMYEPEAPFVVWLYQLALQCMQDAESGELPAPVLDDRVVETLPPMQQALLRLSAYNRGRVVLARDRNLSVDSIGAVYCVSPERISRDIVLALAALNGFHEKIKESEARAG